MNEMLNYIFGSMNASERAIKRINRTLQSQNSINARTTLCLFISTACILAMSAQIKEQSKEIEKLSDEVKELKKGE